MTPDREHGIRQPAARQDETKGCAGLSACSENNALITRPDDAISPYRAPSQGLRGVLSTYFVDGACPNNGANTGQAYGSWCKVEDGVITEHETFPLPSASTNNEAEYQALIHLLTELYCRPKQDSVIYCDSRLIVEQTNLAWKVKEERLRVLRDKARSLLNGYVLRWTPREEVERYLGH